MKQPARVLTIRITLNFSGQNKLAKERLTLTDFKKVYYTYIRGSGKTGAFFFALRSDKVVYKV